ncbi:tumor necrosis factor ligand superfamily member 14-like [Synchiropus splendidus]|uniref:tumor necrosis factor ligand superfamily member 14-like n=1 Tax=Synchiropus splendidus TaxID=270530 RepID=UPI00237DFB32|nr:tumor necrosis factor ligand superfamily member 14-like [Synchiropus splendidus]
MAEGGAASRPQVFLVDSQASLFHSQPRSKPSWTQVVQKIIPVLVLLSLMGLAVEGYFIYKLFQKTESGVNPVHGNEGSHQMIMGQSPVEPQQKKPVAHLMGSESYAGDHGVVQWMSQDGEAFIKHMGYRNGRLIVEEEGIYYIYNKVQLNTSEKCSVIKHKVMKFTANYNHPIDLMTSMIFQCPNKSVGGEDRRDSFLAGTFHLRSGDEIYVTVGSIDKLRPGHTQNFLGAFMISPSSSR